MIEEDGEAIAKVVLDVKKRTLHPIIEEHVEAGTHVETDELLSYGGPVRKGYTHGVVNHSGGEYVAADGSKLNAVENLWKHLNAAIRFTHISVSPQHLEKYVKEIRVPVQSPDAPRDDAGRASDPVPEVEEVLITSSSRSMSPGGVVLMLFQKLLHLALAGLSQRDHGVASGHRMYPSFRFCFRNPDKV